LDVRCLSCYRGEGGSAARSAAPLQANGTQLEQNPTESLHMLFQGSFARPHVVRFCHARNALVQAECCMGTGGLGLYC
jgi:hypothetical protein